MAIAASSCHRGEALPSAGFVDAPVAAVRVAQVQLAQARVLCPFHGLVVNRDLEEGEWAAPGTPVVTVEDLAHLWVRLDVEEPAPALRPGMTAEVVIRPTPQEPTPVATESSR